MIFYLIGINYRTVSPKVYEAAYCLRDTINEYCKRLNPRRTAILVTCNRIEIYGTAVSQYEAKAFIDSFRHYFKVHFKDAYVLCGNEEVYTHGIRLACGLESQLKGEIQIFHQLESWVIREDFPVFLKSVWNDIIETSRQIRMKSGLNRNTTNIAELIFNELRKVITFKEQTKIMVIGTGKVAALIAENRPSPGKLLFVARKKHAKAKRFAELTGGTTLLPEDIPDYLLRVDAVISATSSPHRILTSKDFDKALKIRKKKLYIYDLAIPRDVAPNVCGIPFVVLRRLKDIKERSYYRNKFIKKRIEVAAKLAVNAADEYRRSINARENQSRYAIQQISN